MKEIECLSMWLTSYLIRTLQFIGNNVTIVTSQVIKPHFYIELLSIKNFFGSWLQQNFYRHGVRQLRSAWFDGPAYITQCPIQPGQSYLYNFTITGQRGTLFWHAHISWMRSTVHGAFIIRPKPHHNYPFPTPIAEIPIVLGTKQFESHSQFQT